MNKWKDLIGYVQVGWGREHQYSAFIFYIKHINIIRLILSQLIRPLEREKVEREWSVIITIRKIFTNMTANRNIKGGCVKTVGT